ncbi:hypothetical protein [Streptomyces chartreusis]|uniref:hypothetical protein n=1 Tax=Streptomyces chartreusis TaxID=1969 RepID=UPI003663C44C
MSSDIVPAAVPGPDRPPATPTGTAPAGGITGLLSAVDPARPDGFHITPTDSTAGAEGLDAGAVDASSAAFDLADDNTTDGAGNSKGKQDARIMRAWLLAGAERWRKGADARNKRLDIQKARAQAFKESRKVTETRTVNRAEKIGGGSTNSSTGSSGSGRSLTGKNNAGGRGSSGNSSGGRTRSPGGHGSSGRGGGAHKSAGGSQGPGSHGGGSGKSRHSPAGKETHGGPGHSGSKHNGGHSGGKGPSPKGKDRGSKGGGAGSGSDHRQTRSTGPSGGSSDSSGASGAQDTGGRQKARKDSHGSAGAGGRRKPVRVHSPGSSSGTPWRTPATDKGSNDPAAKPETGDPAKKTDKSTKTPAPADKTGKTPPPVSPKTVNTTKRDGAPGKQAPAAGAGAGSRVDTKESREAGYRDGSRAAQVVAHTQAYRDGVRDGFRDTKDLAAKDKARLDKAHDARLKARQQPRVPVVPPKPPHPPKPAHAPDAATAPKPPKPSTGPKPSDKDKSVPAPAPKATTGQDTSRPDQPKTTTDPEPTTPKGDTVTQPDTSTDTPPTPVKVTSIEGQNVHLGDGAARPHMTRGEVRTLCDYQRRLSGKSATMRRISDYTRALEQHAQERAKTVTHLLEQARAKEAGHLIGTLTQLQEAANVLVERASQLHKRATRADEACTTVIGNVGTRYQAIYQAVVDSPETAPAEMSYYMEMDHAV